MFKTLLILPFVLFLHSAAHASEAGRVLGLWYTPERDVTIEITTDGKTFSGRIVAMDEPIHPADAPDGLAGKPKTDTNNPDENLRSRPIVGLQLVGGFTFGGGNEWIDGTIYNPRDGETYQCVMTLQEDGTLEVHGYVGIPLFGKTQIWTRRTEPL